MAEPENEERLILDFGRLVNEKFVRLLAPLLLSTVTFTRFAANRTLRQIIAVCYNSALFHKACRESVCG